MLGKVGLGGLFQQKSGHPLADPRECRRIIGELPKDNAFKALDEIVAWLESLIAATDFPEDQLYEVLIQLEECALFHLGRLSREYLQNARQSRAEERRLWAINTSFWRLLSDAYEHCLDVFRPGLRQPEALRQALPALCARQIAALATLLKWELFHYAPTLETVWGRVGHAILVAESEGVDGKAVTLGGAGRVTSPAQEFRKLVIFQSASPDSLRPVDMELAERLIAHYLPGFVCTAMASHDSVYWIDLAQSLPPQRLARMPTKAEKTQRFFRPAAAHAELKSLLLKLERGDPLPADINLGAQYASKAILPALRHLVTYLAPIPPQREHDRHRVTHRMSVLHGLVNAFVVFSGEFGGRPAGLQIEDWAVENVSRGGFGALVPNVGSDWLKVGALIAMQPDGGSNWLLGIVRRCLRENGQQTRVGIQTLARKVVSVDLRGAEAGVMAGVPGLMLGDGNAAGETRLILPAGSFSPLEVLECRLEGQRCLLKPVAIVEQTADYELARYRLETPLH